MPGKGGGKDKGKQKETQQHSNKHNPKANSNNATTQPAVPLTLQEGQSYTIIDGSMLEGGGQILRNCFSLSSLLQKPIKISKIRAGRDKPGLKAQHLKGIELIRELYQGALSGGVLHSSEVTYIPHVFSKETKFVCDIQTAGAVCLLIQVSLPCIIMAGAPISLVLKGGTNASAAPPIDYLIQVFKPYAVHFGIDFDIELEKRGFYPRGGGVVNLTSRPVKELKPITIINRGKVVSIHATAFVAGKIPVSVAERMLISAKGVIKQFCKLNVIDYQENAVNETHCSTGDGTMIMIIAKTDTGCIFGASAIGERGVTSEAVGEKAGNELVKNLAAGGCMDEYLQDQLIIFMALAKGTSSIKTGPLELHTKTSIHFATYLTGAKFTVEATPKDQLRFDSEDSYIITCEGIGYQNQLLK